MGSLVGLMGYIIPVKLITFLAEKRAHPKLSVPGINEVDIYQFDPSDLPALSETNSDDQVWYFFIEPYYKSAKSERAHRATRGGNWKITGKRRDVKDEGKVIGSKNTLVFCRRERTSKETETDWVMHEFYVKDSPRFQKNFVVCYIQKKRKKKSVVSTTDDGQPSLGLSSDYVSHVMENHSSEVESQRQQPMSQHMISDSGRHISGSSFLQAEPPPPSSNNLVSEPINPFSEFSSAVGPQLLSRPELDYDLTNQFIASSSSVVESQRQQPRSQHMISDSRRHISESLFLQAEPPPPSSNNLVSEPINPFSEFSSAVGPQLLSRPELNYDLINQFIASSSSMVESQRQQPMSQHMISDSRRHISESSFLQAEPPPSSSNNLVSEPINPFSEFSSAVGPQLLSRPELDYDLINQFIASSSSMFLVQVESQQQQPMSQHMISDSRRHISESSFLQAEPPPPSSNNLVSEPINPFSEFSSAVVPQLPSRPELDYDLTNQFIASSSSMMYQQPPAQFEGIGDYNWLNQSSVPARQSPINPYQGSHSPYSNGISNNCNMGSYQFTGGLEDVVNSQRNVQN